MENSHSQQPQSSEVSASTPEEHTSTPKVSATPAVGNPAWNQFQTKWDGAINFIAAHPLLIWGGLSGTLVTTVAIAILSLIYAGRVEQEYSPPPIAVEEHLPKTPVTQQGNPLPIWLLSILAISCAGGSLLIFKALTQEVRYRKRRQSSVKRVSARKVPRRRSEVQRRTQLASPPPQQMLVQPPAPIPTISVAAIARQPAVTVLSPEETLPLDQSEQSLADMLDIRKQQPLSSLLRNF